MGTRADFYIGRGEQAEWLGSIAMDGYPSGVAHGKYPGGTAMLNATNEIDFRVALAEFFREKGDQVTTPEMGWPWPWDDSRTTDYAYAYDGGKVWASCFGREWFDPRADKQDDWGSDDREVAIFPNMADRKAVTFGKRSGLITFSG